MSSSSESPAKGAGLVTHAGREGHTCSDSRSRSRPCRSPGPWDEQLLRAPRGSSPPCILWGTACPDTEVRRSGARRGEGHRGSALRTHSAKSLSLLRPARFCLPKARPPMSPSPGTKNSFLLDAEKREESKL